MRETEGGLDPARHAVCPGPWSLPLTVDTESWTSLFPGLAARGSQVTRSSQEVVSRLRVHSKLPCFCWLEARYNGRSLSSLLEHERKPCLGMVEQQDRSLGPWRSWS